MPIIFETTFSKSPLNERLKWYNPPAQFEVKKGCLYIYPDAKTDFWQKTHYGFSADNGHFLYLEVAEDFVLTTKVHFTPAHRYDQAGLMVRISPECWLKTSVEYESNEPSKLGVVVTNQGFSDWSSQDFVAARNELELRITHHGEDYKVEASQDGHTWKQLRLAHLHNPEKVAVQCGLYACSPVEAGFEAYYHYLQISSPIPEDALVTLREITEENLTAILRLSETLSDSHRRMVATNAISIAQAHYSKYAWYRGIYVGEDPVGFVMVYIGPEEEDQPESLLYFLWRLMVAEQYQGRGYGRKALEQVMQMAKERGAKEFFTSCGEGEGSPEGFYRKLGFEPTRYEGEELVMRISL
jgi:regulation of enolase protein 1 (concanavalin A-like superfamily)/GNAT superfamily N-acetyltransferase